jgi:hypothetical protein
VRTSLGPHALTVAGIPLGIFEVGFRDRLGSSSSLDRMQGVKVS